VTPSISKGWNSNGMVAPDWMNFDKDHRRLKREIPGVRSFWIKGGTPVDSPVVHEYSAVDVSFFDRSLAIKLPAASELTHRMEAVMQGLNPSTTRIGEPVNIDT
jgi:hypothetical protein